MNAQFFRDTQFGHLVRLISGRRRLQYPDEFDPALWTKSIRRAEQTPKTTRRDEAQAAEVAANPNNQEFDRFKELESRDQANIQDLNINHTIENGEDVFLVDWYDMDDSENPHSWPSSWKLLVAFQICLLNFAFYIASSIYVPGEASIMQDFKVGETVATLGLSLFTVGYGLGPMLWSPMSEMPRVGRNDIYFFAFLAFVLLQLPTGFAVNMPMFLIFRFLTGFLGSPALATGGGTLADMYAPAHLAYGICIWGSFGILGPVNGPILGGFVAQAKDWRWTIWVFTWLCSFTVVMIFFLLPETSAANILYRRAKRLRQATGDDRLKSQSEIDAAHHTWRDHLVVLGRAFTLTFSEPIVFALDLYSALLYGIFFTWFESFPLVFGDIYGFNLGEQGLVFLGILVGGLITVPLYLLWVKRSIVPRFSKPDFKPEMVLPPTFFGSAALPICLFWYGWSARENVHWIVPVIGSGSFTISIVTLFFPVFNYLGISYPSTSASIFAGSALFRASFGATFPLFVSLTLR
ncbi:hypothetical protein H2200_009467 [Cladophialophora chaetospira]|uniref:Major facilitator superfamily (MFS) profile domain-containing protein n=1 Tax=Cladophialophora chaetospira TaxID=386627 RepID=A0AA39CFL1_9EURO|nr:hypothetical protein H2200_009467 [Cladophialophora chaetospira]